MTDSPDYALLPCPFCGGDGEATWVTPYYAECASWMVKCKNCGAIGNCITRWQARVVDAERDRLKAENERLRDALYPRPETKDLQSLILYFTDAKERQEFIDAVQEAKPGMRSYKV